MARRSPNSRLPSGLCSSACSRRQAATARWSRSSPWVLQHDEQAVLTAVELALEAGAPTKTHILNVLHRLIDGKPIDPPAVKPPNALTLTTEPQANVERYDALRKAREARHAS